MKACQTSTSPCWAWAPSSSPPPIEQALAEGKADIIAMARGTIADPYTVEKSREGRPQDIVPCIKCFHCLDDFKKTHYYSCAVNPIAGRETQLDMLVPKEYTKENVAIVGGGPGGMKAALLAAERGHTVTLFEKEEKLGGQLNDADFMSFKYDLKNYKNYLIDHVNASPAITVKLGHAVTPEELTAMGFDEVICAIGATPLIPRIPGVDGDNVIWAGDSFWTPEKVGQKVVGHRRRSGGLRDRRPLRHERQGRHHPGDAGPAGPRRHAYLPGGAGGPGGRPLLRRHHWRPRLPPSPTPAWSTWTRAAWSTPFPLTPSFWPWA